MIIAANISFLIFVSTANNTYKLPLLFFFLPWNGLLKINLESNTFFTLQIVILVVILLWKKTHIPKHIINLIILIFIYSFLIKLFHYDTFTPRYFLVFIFLLFISLTLNHQNKFIPKPEYILLFFSLGTLLANVSGDLLVKLPHMYELNKAAEAQIENEIAIYRNSAFAGDPNRNGANIALALIAILIIKINPLVKGVMSIILFYFGMLTVSKMFYLIAGIIVIFFSISILLTKKTAIEKIFYIIIVGIFMSILSTTNLFQNQIDNFLTRFEKTQGYVEDTRRTSLQLDYLNYMAEKSQILVFGRGFLTDFHPTTNVAHNTFLQLLFGLGIIGGLVYLITLYRIIKTKKIPIHGTGNKIKASLPILSIFLSLNALDYLSIDAFYFFLILIVVIRIYLSTPQRPYKMPNELRTV